MSERPTGEPWTQLERLVDRAEPRPIEEFLESLPPAEAARAVSRLGEESQAQLLTTLEPEEAAGLVDALPEAQAAELIGNLEPRDAASILNELPSNQQADLLGELNPRDVEAILAELQPDVAEELRQLERYPADEAGGLMITELLEYPLEMTTAEVLDDLRAHAELYRDYQVQYTFVTDAERKLRGVLRLRDLLLSPPRQPLHALMIPEPVTVSDRTNLEQLRDFFDQHDWLGVPVVDDQGVLLGLVSRAEVEEALGARVEDDYRKSQGIVKEELRTMPVWLRSRRRLAWLSVNILLNVVAASVIALYQETLSQVIALAVFLPIISDMSGCSGNQAVAVSMRELTLGLIRPEELRRVIWKEVLVGMINGWALGLLLAAVAVLWKGNPYLGLVVGAAMGINTLLAVVIGGCLPLMMRQFKMDPALASGPILTTLTDMCGFFLVLAIATAMLPRLAA